MTFLLMHAEDAKKIKVEKIETYFFAWYVI